MVLLIKYGSSLQSTVLRTKLSLFLAFRMLVASKFGIELSIVVTLCWRLRHYRDFLNKERTTISLWDITVLSNHFLLKSGSWTTFGDKDKASARLILDGGFCWVILEVNIFFRTILTGMMPHDTLVVDLEKLHFQNPFSSCRNHRKTKSLKPLSRSGTSGLKERRNI
jgi:hypothetical protein